MFKGSLPKKELPKPGYCAISGGLYDCDGTKDILFASFDKHLEVSIPNPEDISLELTKMLSKEVDNYKDYSKMDLTFERLAEEQKIENEDKDQE